MKIIAKGKKEIYNFIVKRKTTINYYCDELDKNITEKCVILYIKTTEFELFTKRIGNLTHSCAYEVADKMKVLVDTGTIEGSIVETEINGLTIKVFALQDEDPELLIKNEIKLVLNDIDKIE
jgi:hypothetical protein